MRLQDGGLSCVKIQVDVFVYSCYRRDGLKYVYYIIFLKRNLWGEIKKIFKDKML